MRPDFRAALRGPLANPGWAAAIMLTFAIAIGANTAVFSLVQALVLRPLPFADPHELYFVDAVVAGEPGHISKREYHELVKTTTVAEGFAGYYPSQYNLTQPPEALVSTIGTANLFSLLGTRMMLGSAWPDTMDFRREYQVVLAHHVWQQRFGGRPDIVGQSILMDGGSYHVAGVLPESFDYPLRTAVYRSITDYDGDHIRRLWVVGRLRDGRTLADAQGELDRLSDHFEQAYPDSNAAVRLRARPLADLYVGEARPYLLMLPAAVALLLVVASANVANLMLSRAISRQGELAVRLALGASRRDLARLSIHEALVLAVPGAIAGVLLSRWALQALMAMVRTDLPSWFDVRIDVVTLAFTVVVTVVTAVAVGLVPGWHASRLPIEQTLRLEAGRNAGPRGSRRWRAGLLAAQAAMAAALLVAATAFAIGLDHLRRADVGFEAGNLLTFRTDPPWGRYPDLPKIEVFYREAMRELSNRPGVEAVAVNQRIPFSTLDVASPRVLVEGTSEADAARQPFVNFQVTSPGYFDVMRIPLRQGRAFTGFDTADAPPVAIVSERAAARFWPGGDAIGKRISLAWNQSGVSTGGGTRLLLTVVGVAGNVRSVSVQDEPGLDVYTPYTQTFAGDAFFVIRTRTAPEAVAPEIRRALDIVDPEQSYFDTQPMRDRVAASMWQQQVAGTILGVFALVAFVLAVVGVHAATAYAVEQRKAELGIRLALGAERAGLVAQAVRQALAPVAVGLTAGLGLGAASMVWLADRLPVGGVMSGAGAIVPLGVLLAVAAMAAAWPTLRVIRRADLPEVLRA
jgi:putative ABC transport system permease protein